jgi:hypothetical protein
MTQAAAATLDGEVLRMALWGKEKRNSTDFDLCIHIALLGLADGSRGCEYFRPIAIEESKNGERNDSIDLQFALFASRLL